MKRILWSIAGLCLALPAFGQNTAELKKHWSISKDFTVAVAATMPEADYGFKPNPEEMSFGEMVVHIGQANYSYCSRPTGMKSTFAKPAVITKESALKVLGDSFDFCLASIAAAQAADFDKMVGPEGRQMSGREAFWGGFTHTAHHRAQLEVYLRVKGLKPPDYKF
jgi:uncharacterized damage-inducible protein DinB